MVRVKQSLSTVAEKTATVSNEATGTVQRGQSGSKHASHRRDSGFSWPFVLPVHLAARRTPAVWFTTLS